MEENNLTEEVIVDETVVVENDVNEVEVKSDEQKLDELRLLLENEAMNRKKQRKWLTLVCALTLLGTPTFTFASMQLSNQFSRAQSRQATVDNLTTVAKTAGESEISGIVKKAGQSVVAITKVVKYNGSEREESSGSGVIISEDGYIVTNYHVLAGSSSVINSDDVSYKVKLSDDSEYTATVVGGDSRTDLAVLKIAATGLQKAEISNSDEVIVGETAIAIGNSLGVLGGTVTKGIVSAVNRETTLGTYKSSLIQTDAPVNQGNSGGGLFNATGQLIGIVTQKASGTTVEGLGFAIPSNTMLNITKDIIENGYVKNRPTIGITVQEVNESQLFRSRLEKAGIYVNESSNDALEKYDLLLEVNGKEVANATDVIDAISNNQVGDVIKVKVLRNNQEITVDVTLKEASR